MRHFFAYHFPPILYGLLILALSSIPRLSLPETDLFQVDKLLHFLEYAVFAVLIFRSFSRLFRKQGLNSVVFVSFFFMLVFAMMDEVYQSYIPGRHPDVLDIVLDIFGAAIILSLLWFRQRRKLGI